MRIERSKKMMEDMMLNRSERSVGQDEIEPNVCTAKRVLGVTMGHIENSRTENKGTLIEGKVTKT
jgi:hypothetical protein